MIRASAQERQGIDIVRDKAVNGIFTKFDAPHKNAGFALFQALLEGVITILLDILEKEESMVKKRFLR